MSLYLFSYQEPPPPPPEPPPDEPPPEEDDGEELIELSAWLIVLFINELKVAISNADVPTYQLGASTWIDSNCLTHLSDTPNAYV